MDIEAVDAVAAVVVKEVIVPLANKKSKTVITLPFNFHLISELFYHLEQKTLSHHYSSLKIGLDHQKINHMTRLRINLGSNMTPQNPKHKMKSK